MVSAVWKGRCLAQTADNKSQYYAQNKTRSHTIEESISFIIAYIKKPYGDFI